MKEKNRKSKIMIKEKERVQNEQKKLHISFIFLQFFIFSIDILKPLRGEGKPWPDIRDKCFRNIVHCNFGRGYNIFPSGEGVYLVKHMTNIKLKSKNYLG